MKTTGRFVLPAAALAAALAATPITVATAPHASAMPGVCSPANPSFAYLGPACENCKHGFAIAGKSDSMCYTGTGPGMGQTGFPDCDALPNVQDRVRCGDQHLTGQR